MDNNCLTSAVGGGIAEETCAITLKGNTGNTMAKTKNNRIISYSLGNIVQTVFSECPVELELVIKAGLDDGISGEVFVEDLAHDLGRDLILEGSCGIGDGSGT